VIVHSDEHLLAASRDVDAFGELYSRYARELLGFLLRRTADAQVAADLVAETFAEAFVARRKFRPQGPGSARAWLYGIARRVLGHYLRRERVSDRYRRKLGMVPGGRRGVGRTAGGRARRSGVGP
jgi:RNA polymerase sigma-70 factor (ECF subfamily)